MEEFETTTNYHNSLNYLSKNFDYIIEIFQKQKSEGKLQQNWRVQLLIAVVKDVMSTKGVEKLKTLGKFIASLIAAPWLTTFLLTFWTSSPYWFVGVGILTFLITYYVTAVIFYLPKMLDTTNKKMFHLAAYRDKRPNEFDLFSRAFIYHDFSFTGLEKYVNTILSKQDEDSQMVTQLTNTFDREVSIYREQIEKTEEKYKGAIEELERNNAQTEKEFNQLEDMQSFLIYFLDNINVLLYRLTNNKLSLSDLSFLTGFTIYEEREDKLVKIPNGDHGTTGASLDEISFTDSKFQNYSSVLVSINKETASRYQKIRQGYIIVSYRMKMDKTGEKYWIYNFHVNTNNNKRAWNLLLNDDIINTEEIYRLFHAFCLIIYNQKFGAEGINDATN